MIRTRTSLLFGIAVVLCAAPPLRAQTPAIVVRPSFAGTWQPSDPARSDRYFEVGMSPIPGSGRLVIEQRGERFAVTITMPDDKLDPILAINGRFYSSIMYRVAEPRGRQGGYGAAGPPPPPETGWVGDRVVIPNARPSRFSSTTTYSMDGDRLKVETRTTRENDRISTVTEWFTRVK